MERDDSRRSSLRTRLGLIAIVFPVIVLIAIGLPAMLLRSWDQTVDRNADARLAREDVRELSLGFSRQESAITEYQDDRDPAVLDRYLAGRTLQERAIERLQEHDPDLAGLDERVAATIRAGDVWREQVAVPIVEGESVGAELRRQSFDDVEIELRRLDQLVAADLRRLDERTEDVRRNVFVVLAATAAVAIVAMVLAAVLFRRWVIQPLDDIGTAARALADDDTYPLPRFEAAELQEVSDAVGSLQTSLRAARDDAVAAFDALEQSAVLAVQVRSELADEIGTMPNGWSAHTLLIPAEGVVAGDCFDIGLLDARHLYVVLIDVTGHGASCALNALKAKSQLRAALRSGLAPGAAIDWLSQENLKDERSDLLTTMVAVIELDTGRTRHANAGHPPALLTDGTQALTLEQPGPVVGAFAATWPTGEMVLRPGWTMLLHTDGITDMLGTGSDRFGFERLEACLTTPDPVELLAGIEAAVEGFRVAERTDDIAAIAIHRAGGVAEVAETSAVERAGTAQP